MRRNRPLLPPKLAADEQGAALPVRSPRRAVVSLTTAVLERHCKWTQRVVGYKLLLRKAEAQAKESQRAQAKPDVIIDRDGHQ